MLHALFRLFSILCPSYSLENINVEGQWLASGQENSVHYKTTQSLDSEIYFGSSKLPLSGILKDIKWLCAPQSLQSLEAPGSSVSHANRKDWCVLPDFCVLRKWPFHGKLKHKAITNLSCLLPGKMTV